MEINELKEYFYKHGYKDKNPNVVSKSYGTTVVGSMDYKETYVEYWFIPKHDRVVMQMVNQVKQTVPVSIATISNITLADDNSLVGFENIKDKTELLKLRKKEKN